MSEVSKISDATKASDDSKDMISVSEFSRKTNLTEKQIIERIRNGTYVGSTQNRTWYISKDELSRQDHEYKVINISKCINPNEENLFWLACLIVLPVLLIFVVVTEGFGLLIVPIILFFAWFITKIWRASLIGNCGEVTTDNFPKIYQKLVEISQTLDYQKKVEVFIYQESTINTILLKLFGTQVILLPHETIVAMIDDEKDAELTFLLSRAIGHLKAKHLRLSWLTILLNSFENLVFLNIFLYPWERATQYTGDNIGLVTCHDLEVAVSALNKLILGKEISSQMSLEGTFQQTNKLKGSIFSWFAECLSPHPHLIKRITSLIRWAQINEPPVYDKFIEKQENKLIIESMVKLTT